MTDESTAGVHWSFWVIGGFGLIFNLMGCVNFLSQMNSESVASMPDAYRAIVETRPAWATGTFAVAVFGGALGALLLLLRKSTSYYVLIASLVGAVATQLPALGDTDFPAGALAGGMAQLVVGAFLIWYAKRSTIC